MPPAAPNESLPGEPTNLQRRQNADNDTENRNNSDDRRASNLKAYHEGQIADLQKEIDKHQAIVDQQDKILSGELDANTPLPAGTDIAARFRQGEDGSDERPPGSVNDLRAQREQERREREGNDDKSDTSNDTSDTSDNTSTEPVSTPATPVSDDAPKQDEAKLDDATAPDATKPTPKMPTPPSNRDTTK